jgi:hypothetical protein
MEIRLKAAVYLKSVKKLHVVDFACPKRGTSAKESLSKATRNIMSKLSRCKLAD